MNSNTPECSCKRNATIAMGIIGFVIMAYGIIIVLVSNRLTTIPEHHLLHAGMSVGAGLLALALAALLPRNNGERSWWVIVAILAPAAGLFLMWPTAYAYLMGHPVMHAMDHIGIAVCSLLAVFAAQAYVRGLGWPMLVLMVGMNAAAAGGFGVTNNPLDPHTTSPMPGMMHSDASQANPAISGRTS